MSGLLRGALAAAFALLVAGPSNALADPTPAATGARCKTEEIEEPPTSEFPLSPARKYEIWTSLSLEGDWVSRALVSPTALVALDVVPHFLLSRRQTRRLAAHIGFGVGNIGNNISTTLVVEPGLAYRQTLQMSDFFDVYALFKVSVPIPVNAGPNGRAGVGLGVRVIRAVQIEASFDPVYAPERGTGNDHELAPGIGVSLGYDLCLAPLDCGYETKAVENHPLTCHLYDAAEQTCKGLLSRPAELAKLCESVSLALDAAALPVGASDPELDDVDRFLAAVEKADVTEETKKEISSLAARNRSLAAHARASRAMEREKATHEKRLVEHCTYEPTVLELRSALGCEHPKEPRCTRRHQACSAAVPK